MHCSRSPGSGCAACRCGCRPRAQRHRPGARCTGPRAERSGTLGQPSADPGLKRQPGMDRRCGPGRGRRTRGRVRRGDRLARRPGPLAGDATARRTPARRRHQTARRRMQPAGLRRLVRSRPGRIRRGHRYPQGRRAAAAPGPALRRLAWARRPPGRAHRRLAASRRERRRWFRRAAGAGPSRCVGLPDLGRGPGTCGAPGAR
jgi:hypothetical protein